MNSFKHYLLLVAISLLPFVFVLATPDLPHTHDGGVHLPRIAAYVKAIRDGHIPVRWAGDLNYGYGLPLFNFMYQTPYAIGSLLVLSGISLVSSFKILLIISFVFSGVGMYAFAKEFLRDNQKALVVSVFYQFAPFRLIEILARGSIGSLYAYAFFPFVLYGIAKRSFFVTAFATMLVIISHNSLSLVFFGISILFSLVFSQTYSLRKNLSGLLAGLMLASFYWIPALLEHKFTYGDLYMKDIFRQHFPPLYQLLIPNLTNDMRLNSAQISMQLGLFHTLSLILASYLLWTRRNATKQTRVLFVMCISIAIATLFFMQPVSNYFWTHIALLRQFQFPWRLLAVMTIATSLSSVSFFSFKISRKPWFIPTLMIAVIFSTVAFWIPPEGFDRNIDEQTYWNYPLNTTYFGETDVIWSAGPAKEYPQAPVEVIDGKATISDYRKKTQKHTFTIQADTDVMIVDNTQYFPGWRVYVNNAQVAVEFQDANHRGLMTYRIPQGTHTVSAVFGESKSRAAADAISVLALVVVSGRYIWEKRK